MRHALRNLPLVKSLPALMRAAIICVVAMAPVLARGDRAQSRPLRVLVASSLQPLFEHLRPVIEQKAGRRMDLIGGASSVLARQLRQGLSADVFFSAEKKWVVAVDPRPDKTLAAETRLWMTDEMVMFRRETLQEGKNPERPQRVALGEPLTVPLGAAAQKLLPLAGDQIAANRQLVFGNSALAVIRYVESGAADLGFATRSLVQHRKGLFVVKSFGGAFDGQIRYWISVLDSSAFSRSSQCSSGSDRFQSKCASGWEDLFFGAEMKRAVGEWGLTLVAVQESAARGRQGQ